MAQKKSKKNNEAAKSVKVMDEMTIINVVTEFNKIIETLIKILKLNPKGNKEFIYETKVKTSRHTGLPYTRTIVYQYFPETDQRIRVFTLCNNCPNNGNGAMPALLTKRTFTKAGTIMDLIDAVLYKFRNDRLL